MDVTVSASVLKWIDFAKSILPLGLAAAGVPADKIQPVVASVADAEIALGPGTGSAKLQAVLQGLTDTMTASGASAETIQATSDAVANGLATTIAVVNDVNKIHNAPAAGAAPAGS